VFQRKWLSALLCNRAIPENSLSLVPNTYRGTISLRGLTGSFTGSAFLFSRAVLEVHSFVTRHFWKHLSQIAAGNINFLVTEL
jgi:hypothetical protein